ncbi:MAG: hypothetical protein IPO87_09330 [Flavobacteriales bacterium]|nr:hypothetical protein [Flavobacteriales bacterium]
MAAEKARLDEERRLKEAADAEVARLAAANAQESAEAERLRKEREAEEARLAAEERDRKARESVQELDARYQASIVRADEAMAAKDYLNARGIYGEASDIKPDETYPLAKIDQIDRLLAEQERLRLEAELAAQNKEKPKEVVRTPSTNVGSGQEDEAIRFMREAREREEAEKYDRIRKFRSDLQNTEAENADEAAIRRDAPIQQKERLQGESAQLYRVAMHAVNNKLMTCWHTRAHWNVLKLSEDNGAKRHGPRTTKANWTWNRAYKIVG